MVDAVLHNAAQRGVQLLWRHVVLVLPDTDRLWINLHQLRQGVLQSARNRNGAAQRDVKLRELLRSQLGRRVNRGACLADHHIGDLIGKGRVELLEQLGDKDLRLLAGSSISDGDHRHPIPTDQCTENLLCLLGFFLRRRWIDHRCVQHLSCGVHHCNLASGAVGRVKPHRHRSLHRRLHQQGFQIL